MKKHLIFIISCIALIVLLSACNKQVDIENEEKKENLVLLFTELRHNLANFNFEGVDKIYVELNQLLEDDTFDEDRDVLEGYLNSIYSSKDEGVAPYQQFLKDLPEDYNGILSDLLWEDHNKLYGQK